MGPKQVGPQFGYFKIGKGTLGGYIFGMFFKIRKNGSAPNVRHGRGSSFEATKGIHWRDWETFTQARLLSW